MYILAIDQGTTSSRVIVFDKDQNMVSVAQKEFTQIYPQEGWVEHDPNEIWATQYGVLLEALGKANIDPKDIKGVGITNQRETTVVGIKIQASLCIMLLYGNVDVQQIYAKN